MMNVESILQSESGIWLVSGCAGMAVFFIGLAALSALSHGSDPLRRRVRSVSENRDGKERKLVRFLVFSAPYFEPKKSGQKAELNRRLELAGYRANIALPLFVVMRLGGVIFLALVGLGIAALLFHAKTANIVIFGCVGAVLGYICPSFILDKKLMGRQKALRNSVPDMLDLLVVCTDAGLGLDAGLQRVALRMERGYPAMASEMKMVNAEIGAGIDRLTALSNMANRSGVEEMAGFVSSLRQSMRFGISIGESLHVYAEEFRDKRKQRAEEMAAQLPVKLLAPIMLCLLPAFIIVLGGPLVYSIAEAFFKL